MGIRSGYQSEYYHPPPAKSLIFYFRHKKIPNIFYGNGYYDFGIPKRVLKWSKKSNGKTRKNLLDKLRTKIKEKLRKKYKKKRGTVCP